MKAYCKLCHYDGPFEQINDRLNRTLNKCPHCKLVFAERDYLPRQTDEKARYEEHNNSIEDKGYVRFLMQAIHPALACLLPESKGLDYGCGPVPVLSQLLNKKGLTCMNFDPFFFPELPEGPFDYLFATECFEHFFEPEKEMQQICKLLNPAGLLIVMTDFWSEKVDFSKWYYSRDRTHVSFYSEHTFDWMAKKFGFEVVFSDHRRVIILRKNSGPDSNSH